MKTLLFLIFLSILTSCGVADKIESSHYRLWNRTVALKIDSITYKKVYFEDFIGTHRYSLKFREYRMLVGCPDVGDTIFIRDHEDLLPKFKFEKK